MKCGTRRPPPHFKMDFSRPCAASWFGVFYDTIPVSSPLYPNLIGYAIHRSPPWQQRSFTMPYVEDMSGGDAQRRLVAAHEHMTGISLPSEQHPWASRFYVLISSRD